MTERLPASFRDPAGFVFRRNGVLYRQVNWKYRENYDTLMKSGLYDELVARRLLIPHTEVDVAPAQPDLGSVVIMPQPVQFISYPFEWCPGQLLSAAEATLKIQRIAVDHGMSLRDASAYNIQFHNGEPLLIDTLSFEPLTDGKPWVAYGQYCRHFLAPLALIRHVDVRLGDLLRTHLDGVPLDLAATLLPWRTRLRLGLGLHLHAHAASQRRHASDRGKKTSSTSRGMSRRALLGLIDSLLTATRRQRWQPIRSTWRDYYAVGESYSSASMRDKREIVTNALKDLSANIIWDLGGNTGEFSRLAADVTGAQVVSIEMDASAVEVNWRDCQESGRTDVLPLLNNLANPTPAQGWSHVERASLSDRGPAEVVLALALLHHLAIGNNVPLHSVLGWFSSLGRTIIVEWIPKEDPMVHALLSTREDVFTDYSAEEFEAAASRHFRIKAKDQIKDSMRYVYVLERH